MEESFLVRCDKRPTYLTGNANYNTNYFSLPPLKYQRITVTQQRFIIVHTPHAWTQKPWS